MALGAIRKEFLPDGPQRFVLKAGYYGQRGLNAWTYWSGEPTPVSSS